MASARAGGPNPRRARVAVIGAGVAGLACARALGERGLSVRVFEREGHAGGRLSSRRLDGLSFDHGVQFFTTLDSRFEPVVRAWQSAGVVVPWTARTKVLAAYGQAEELPHQFRYVGVPSMQAVAEHMARGLDVRFGLEVARLDRLEGLWTLFDRQGGRVDDTGFDRVVLAVPSPVAAALLPASSRLSQRAQAVTWDSCWSVMLTLARPSAADFDAAFLRDDPILGWAARESSKPSRSGNCAEAWILQAHPAWSRTYLEMDESAVSRWLQRAFAARVGRPLAQGAAAAHRWRLALPVNPLAETFLFDSEQGLGLAGDWCGGPRVEGAYLSGASLAQVIAA